MEDYVQTSLSIRQSAQQTPIDLKDENDETFDECEDMNLMEDHITIIENIKEIKNEAFEVELNDVGIEEQSYTGQKLVDFLISLL